MPFHMPSLSLSKKLGIIIASMNAALVVFQKLLIGPFRGAQGASTLCLEISNAVSRMMTTRLSISQLQFIRGTSTLTFEKWANDLIKKGQLNLSEIWTEDVGEDAKLLWIGRKDAKKVLLHFHGGGYVLPLSTGHLVFLHRLREQLTCSLGSPPSITILQYANAPEATYPTQLRQANAAFVHILYFHHVPSSSLLLLGDSAGGHFLLTLLSHLVHGHPALPTPISLQHSLAGILLLSPSTTHRKIVPSFAENRNKDIVRPEIYERWFSAFCGPAISTLEGLEADGWWTEHLGAPEEWWTGIGTTISKRILLSAGEHECYRDDIKAFVGKLAEEMKGEPVDLVFHLETRDVHNSLCFYPPGTAPEELFELVATWVTESLSD